jgi:hypothetical protein
MVSKREAMRRERLARQRRRNVLYGTGVLALVLLVGGLVWASSQGQASCANLQDPIRNLYNTLPVSQLSNTVKMVAAPYSKPLPEPTGVEVDVANEGSQHVTVADIPYQANPPASGPHYDLAASYGFNTKEVPEGNWVHSLEHGAIVLLYHCESGRVTAIAWDHQLTTQGVDTAKITEFYNKYVDQGPEKVP